MHSTHSSARILLPVRPGFIVFTVFVAFLLNFFFSNFSDPRLWIPDWVALVLVFWSIREPQYVGMGSAFVSGLVMDVADASLMGQHALAYVVVCYASVTLSKRVLRFPLKWQALQALPLLIAVQVVQLCVRLSFGVSFPGFGYFVGPFLGAALWFPLAHLLLLPQYQPVERDENRPI
ncbi:MAG: rod shape-determining protein MreD [Candidatus Accumulibacter sp.]|jgi:rod shape-determining protein MreD|nr:rod shape-determining protein MreD [Accumulibacter sp.]